MYDYSFGVPFWRKRKDCIGYLSLTFELQKKKE